MASASGVAAEAPRRRLARRRGSERLGGLTAWELLKRVRVQITRDDVSAYAAQLAYYCLFALFPFLMFLAALLAYIPIPNLFDRIVEMMGEFVPASVMQHIEGNIEQLLTETRGGLLSTGILIAVWIASNGFAAVSVSLNRAYGVREQRPFWKVRGLAVLMTVGLAVLLILWSTVLVFGPLLAGWLAENLGFGGAFEIIVRIVRWPVIIFLMILTVALIYYFAPDVEQDWRWITPGSVVAVIVWVLVSLGFAFYVDNFGRYDRVYGSIGVIIILLTWLYISALFLLIGGEINAEIENAAEGGKDKGEKEMPD